MVAKCDYCGERIEAGDTFVVEGIYPRPQNILWRARFLEPEELGQIFHRQCYPKMLKEAQLEMLREAHNPESSREKPFLAEILEAVSSMGGKAKSINELSKKLHPGKETDEGTMSELMKNVETLEAYGFLTLGGRDLNASAEITDEGKSAIALDRQDAEAQEDIVENGFRSVAKKTRVVPYRSRSGAKDKTARARDRKIGMRELKSPELQQIDNCMVCSQPLSPRDDVVYCPHCSRLAHRNHLIDWLHTKKKCPACGENLDEQYYR
jgi:hypothetical protein